MERVIVMPVDAAGGVIGISNNNTEWGYIRVEQHVPQITEGGWLRYVKRSALLKGTVEDLKRTELVSGSEIAGRIIVKESFTPFYEEDPQKSAKIAGSTGVPCTKDGQQIYRESFFTTDPNQTDELIAHDNSEDIKMAQEVKNPGLHALANLAKEQVGVLD